MIFDAEKFLNEFNVPISTEGKNTQAGWINVQCPFCDDSSNHGGFNLSKGYYNCWKCGGHSLVSVIMKLANLDFMQSQAIIKQYSLNKAIKQRQKSMQSKKVGVSIHSYIKNQRRPYLDKQSREYLESRNFNPDELMEKYKLYSTGAVGEYSFRILAPIFYKGQMVSFQARAIFPYMIPKYKACPQAQEIIKHKDVFYNLDNATNGSAILVEGITDVWRLGKDTIGSFGTSFTLAQTLLLKDRYKKVFVVFDGGEKIAQKKADKLSGMLNETENCECVTIEMDSGDPADLSEEEALLFKKDLLRDI